MGERAFAKSLSRLVDKLNILECFENEMMSSPFYIMRSIFVEVVYSQVLNYMASLLLL